jgi:hypothetical protein
MARLRGAQAVLFLSGWLLSVDDERLVSSAGAQPFDLLTPESARLLRGSALPRLGAAATLSLVLREPPAALAAVRLGDVASDASHVRAQAGAVDVPEPFRFLLAAQRLERIIEGAVPEDPLFVARARGQRHAADAELVPMTPLAIHRLLKTVVRETGLLVTTSFSAAQLNEQSLHWSRRRGFSFKRLDGKLARRVAA